MSGEDKVIREQEQGSLSKTETGRNQNAKNENITAPKWK
jgi:hypothetical protein